MVTYMVFMYAIQTTIHSDVVLFFGNIIPTFDKVYLRCRNRASINVKNYKIELKRLPLVSFLHALT